MLADAEEVEAYLVREHALVDDVAKCLCLRQLPPVGIDGHVAEGIHTQFNRIRHVFIVSRTSAGGEDPAAASRRATGLRQQSCRLALVYTAVLAAAPVDMAHTGFVTGQPGHG